MIHFQAQSSRFLSSVSIDSEQDSDSSSKTKGREEEVEVDYVAFLAYLEEESQKRE